MNKQNKKSKNQVSTESLFKPIIATSLAVALGVSVSVGAPIDGNITQSTTIASGSSYGKAAEFDSGFGAPTVNDSKAGFLFNGGGAQLSFGASAADLSTGEISGQKNAYGIYINQAAATAITSQAFNTITIGQLTANGGEAYVFKNGSTSATGISNVGIVYGAKSLANTNVAIADSLGGHYDFGTTGTTITLSSPDTTTGNVAGFDISGGKTTTLKGTLTASITAGNGNGGNVKGTTTGFYISGATLDTTNLTAGTQGIKVDAAQGGTATGIKLSNNATLKGNLTFDTLGTSTATTTQGLALDSANNTLKGNLTFAKQLGTNANDKKISGIENTTTTAATLSGYGEGAASYSTITFAQDLVDIKDAHIINASTGGLTFNNVGVIVENTTGTILGANIGLIHGVATAPTNGLNYFTGESEGNAKTITFNVTGKDGDPAVTAVGLDLKSDLALAYTSPKPNENDPATQQVAKFEFNVKGGVGKGSVDGGNAVGLILNDGKTIKQSASAGAGKLAASIENFNSLTLSVVGGAGTCMNGTAYGTCPGNGGDAVAILLNTQQTSGSSLAGNTINIKEVKGGFANLGSNLGKAYVIANYVTNAASAAKKLTLNENTRINVGKNASGNSLINHAQNIEGDKFALDLIQHNGGIYSFGTGTDALTITSTENTITLMNLTGAAELRGGIDAYTTTKATKANVEAGSVTILKIKDGKLSTDTTGVSIGGTAGIVAGLAKKDVQATAAGTNGKDGAKGGSATGIDLDGNTTSFFAGSLAFTKLQGGNGADGQQGADGATADVTEANKNGGKGGNGGNGGDAIGITGSGTLSSYGIENSRASGQSESYLGGTLTFNTLTAGTAGTGGDGGAAGNNGVTGNKGNDGQAGSAYVISTNSSITFEGISIIADKNPGANGASDTNINADTTYGLYHENINGGVTPQYKGDIIFKNVVNIGDKNVIGLDLQNDIDLSEAKLKFETILNDDKENQNINKDAIGMQMYANTGITKANIASKKKELTFGSVISTRGTAIGLNILDANAGVTAQAADLTGHNLTFEKIDGKDSNAYAIKNDNAGVTTGGSVSSLNLDDTTTLLFGKQADLKAVISHNGTDGLYQFSKNASVNYTSIKLGNDKDTALSFSGIGLSGIAGNLNISSVAAPTAASFTALKIAGGTPSSRASEVGVLTLINGKTTDLATDFANAITLTAGGKADAIGIDASGTFALGGTLTFADITSGTAGASDAIGLRTSSGATIKGANNGIGQIVFEKFQAKSDCCGQVDPSNPKGIVYVIKNGQGTLELDNVGVVAGGGLVDTGTVLGKHNTFFGIYHGTGIAGAKYDFGTTGTTISMVNGKGDVTAEDKNVIGLAVADDLTLSGKLTFTSLQNNNVALSAKNKNAVGVYITNDKILKLDNSVVLASDNIKAQGDVFGIYIGGKNMGNSSGDGKGATLDITASDKVDFAFTGLDSGSDVVGNAKNKTYAYGLVLESADSNIKTAEGKQLKVSASGAHNVAALGTKTGITQSITLSAASTLDGDTTAIRVMDNNDTLASIGAGSVITVEALEAKGYNTKAYVIDAQAVKGNTGGTDFNGDGTNDISNNNLYISSGNQFQNHARIDAGTTAPTNTDYAIYHGIADAGYAGNIEVGQFTAADGSATGMIIEANTFIEKGKMSFNNVAATKGDVAALKLGKEGSTSATKLTLDTANILFKKLTRTDATKKLVGLEVAGDSTISSSATSSTIEFASVGSIDSTKPFIAINNDKSKLTIKRGVQVDIGTRSGGDKAVISNNAPSAGKLPAVIFNFGTDANAYTFVDGDNELVKSTSALEANKHLKKLTVLNLGGGAKLTGNLIARGISISDYSSASGTAAPDTEVSGGDLVGFAIDGTNPKAILHTENFKYTLIGGDGYYREGVTSNGGNVTGFEATASQGVLDINNSTITLNLKGGDVRNIQGDNDEENNVYHFNGGNASAINVAPDKTLTVKNGQLVFKDIQGGFGNKRGKAYAFDNLVISVKNQGSPSTAEEIYQQGILSIDNTASLVFGDKAKVALPDGTKFGIYQGIKDLNYAFGTTTVNVGGVDTNDAIGLVLAEKANFESGVATFNINGKNVVEGIRVNENGNAELNFVVSEALGVIGNPADDKVKTASMVFNVGTDETISSNANAIGIRGNTGTLTIRESKEEIKNPSNKEKEVEGGLAFNIGNDRAKTATGLSLSNTVFKGKIEFRSITAEKMFGLTNGDGTNSVIKEGSEIKFGTFRGAGATVLDNAGTLTIHKGAAILAGNNPNTATDFATIRNNLEDVNYNLGNLNLVLADVERITAAKIKTVTGIKSDKLSANFIVEGEKTLRIEGRNYGNYAEFGAQKAFDGAGLNLILKNGAKVELGVDGGKIARLQADSTGTINLAGDPSRTRDTNGIFYRSLKVDELATKDIPKTFANTTAEPVKGNGANFVVLASRTGTNGTLKAQLDQAVNDKTGFTGTTGYAYNADGSLYTMKKEIAGYEYNQQGNLVFDEFGNAVPVYREVYSLNQGGSDRIIIDNTTGDAVERVDATLQVGVRGVEGNEKDNTPKYVVLAAVKNRWVGGEQLKDKVTFNGLKDEDGKRTTLVKSQDGFDVVTIELARKDIQRDGLDTKEVKMTEKRVGQDGKVTYADNVATVTEDWSDVGAVYYSDLRAKDREINNTLADASLSLINTNYMLMSANLNSLNKRLGELRNTDNSQGLWGRLFAGQQSADFGMKQTTTYLTFQVGYDYNFKVGNGTNYVGAAISYISGSSTQDKANFSLVSEKLSDSRILANASAKSNGFEAALYNTYVAENGFYSDSIFKVGYSMSNLNVPEQTQTYDVDNYSIALSEEVGYKVTLGSSNEWNITPQVELAYAFINDANFTQSFKSNWMSVSQDAAQMLRTRVGVNWAYSFDHLADEEKGIKANLYVGTYYAYDANFGGKTNLRTNGGSVKSYDALKSDGRFVLNVGTDVSIQDATKFYVDFEKSFGGTLQTDYQFSVGVRYGFGTKNSEVKKDGEDKKAAPLKIKDEEQK